MRTEQWSSTNLINTRGENGSLSLPTLTQAQADTITPFDTVIVDTADAAHTEVDRQQPGFTFALTADGKTIAFSYDIRSITTSNVKFSDGSVLLAGDNQISTAGDPLANVIVAPATNDKLLGFGGPDQLFGGDGNDVLNGGPGNDLLDGGSNTVGGLDLVSYREDPAGVTVDLVNKIAFDGFGTTDTLVGIEGAFGSAFGDVLLGDGGSNRFLGYLGDDRIDAGPGRDFIVDTGNTVIDAEGPGNGYGHLKDHNNGNDDAPGHVKHQPIVLTTDNDIYTGGAGPDTFTFLSTNNGRDTITDFQAGEGIGDVLNLSTWGFDDFKDVLKHTTDTAAGAVISIDGINSITLAGVTSAQLASDDFLL